MAAEASQSAGGQLAAKDDAGGLLAATPAEDDAGVDRLSALPDDALTRILVRLEDAAAAGRTSVLSTRWRRLWLRLTELRFAPRSSPRRVAAALAAHDAALSHLSVGTLDADADSVAAWLPAVARRLTGDLIFTNHASDIDGDGGGEERGALELPCLAKATSLTVDLGGGGLGLAVPPAGVFARLTDISLTGVVFRGPCALGDAVSSPRCPCLLTLTLCSARGLDELKIRSDSLREMTLKKVRGLEQLAVASPALEYLSVLGCFISGLAQLVADISADISAPALKVLRWGDVFDPIFVHLGTVHLESVCPKILFMYGPPAITIYNQSCLELLRYLKTIQCLNLTLAFLPNMDVSIYLMEDLTILPDIMNLYVRVIANEHAFGAGLFHVLRLCSGIKELTLELAPPMEEAQVACRPGCICNEKEHWKTEELLLGHLQEVEVTRLRGSQHEVTLLKQLFSWATVLKKFRVTFDRLITESMAKELCQMFRSFSRPETCMEFNMYDGSSIEDGNNIQPVPIND